jgi:hypothetical protein
MKRGVSYMISAKHYFSEMELIEDQNISCENTNMGYQLWIYLSMPLMGRRYARVIRGIEGGIVGGKLDG